MYQIIRVPTTRCLNTKPIGSRNILVSTHLAKGCIFPTIDLSPIFKDFPTTEQTEQADGRGRDISFAALFYHSGKKEP